MSINYTLYNENSISNSCSEDLEEDVINYLNHPDNFRLFNEGLTELLEKSGGEENE